MPSPQPIHLKVLRERRGLTQQELASKSGVAQAHISKLERTKQVRGPHWDAVLALSMALRVDPARLRFGPDATPLAQRRRARRRLTRAAAAAAAETRRLNQKRARIRAKLVLGEPVTTDELAVQP